MELLITCCAEKGGLIGAGVYADSKEELAEIIKNDPFWFSVGFWESYYENYHVFEPAILNAAKQSICGLEGKENVSEEELKTIVHLMLEKSLGEITVCCKIDGEEKDSQSLGVDSDKVSNALFEILEPEILNEISNLEA